MGFAQVIEIDEVISREVSFHVGGISTPDIKELVSREASFFIENGRDDGEVVSREFSVVMDAPGAPPQVTGYTVTPAPDGSSVVLDWSNYNQWAVGDVDSFRIYLSNEPFSDVTSATPFLTVPGGSVTALLTGLPIFQDHYIAIVAVDALGNSNPAVVYSAAYILTKEIISREVSVAFTAEPQPPYREVVSREVSVVRDNPGAPAPIGDFVVTLSPAGDTATLDWSSYNQWAEYDVAFYRVYYSDTLFTSLTGIPYVDVPGENFTHTFNNLVPWVDHYFAIVPVDALGASDPVFNYSGGYVLSPEVISREVALFMGGEPEPPYREVVSREMSVVRPDATTPAPITFAGSSFTATTARTVYNGISLDWTGYNEWQQQDVWRYRIYVSSSFFADVSGMTPVATSEDGTQLATIDRLSPEMIFSPETIYYVAVVAEDVEGNFDPVVYSVSAKTAVSELGPVANLTAVPTPTTITFSWDLGGVGDELADFVKEFHVYFNGSTVPIVIGPAERSWTADSLIPGTSYTVTFNTVDLNGAESPGQTISIESLSVPILFLPDTSISQQVVADGMDTRDFRISNYGGASLAYSLPLPAAPTNYAYSRTSLQLPGPAFDWVDTSTGTPLWANETSDDASKSFTFPAGFTFPFYGTQYASVNVCTNGFVSFTAASTNYSNLAFPSTSAPRTAIAVIWRDWYLDTNASVRWKLADPDTIAITWNDIHVFGQSNQRASFQLLLKRSGAIIIQVKYFNTTSLVYSMGVQNSAGNTGYQIVHNPSTEYIPVSPVDTNFAVQVAPMKSWLSISPLAGSVDGGAFGDLSLGFDAAGFPPGVNPSVNLVLATNDELQPTVNVPVTMEVVYPNTPPTISSVEDQTIVANTGTPALAVTVSDTQSTPDSLILSVSSANNTLLPVENIVLGGSHANRTVTATPVANQSGIANITLTVSDGSLSTSINFSLAVLPTLQTWKQTYLGNPAADDLDDPDSDGLATLVEYALNTLPHVGNGSPLTGTRFTYPEGERLRIFVPRDPGRNDITVEVLAAGSLSGPWTTIATSELGAQFTGPGYVAGDSSDPGLKDVEIRDIVNIADAPTRFLRVRVTH
jgi:hypothetical protein